MTCGPTTSETRLKPSYGRKPQAASVTGALIAILVFVGWLLDLGHLRHPLPSTPPMFPHDMAFGISLLVVATILTLAALIWWNVSSHYRAEAAREKAETALRKAYDELETSLAERTAELSNVSEALRVKVIELERAEDAQRQLLHRFVTVQEVERAHIARELHDQTAQYLSALMLEIKLLKKSSAAQPGSHAHLVRLQEVAEQLGVEVHSLAWRLRPAALDDLGLQTALSNYVSKWAQYSGVLVDFHSTGFDQQHLLPQVEAALYRFVQEALTNVLKHARAERMSLILERRYGQVLCIVEDDGCGFDAESVTKLPAAGGRLGILGMRERIAMVGGRLGIESRPGAGTTLVVRIPVPGDEAPLESELREVAVYE